MTREFWRSEIFTIWIQYLAAGVAAIPGGIVYSVLLERSSQGKAAFLISLFVAVCLGSAAWLATGRVLRRFVSFKPVGATASSNLSLIIPGASPAFATGTFVLVVCLSGPSPRGASISQVIANQLPQRAQSAATSVTAIIQTRNWEADQ
jgi:hypothetical protein